MGYLMTARCRACDYARPHLTIGDGEHSLAACVGCRGVVNARYDRFRPFDPVHCPDCRAALDSQSFFFSLLSGPLYPCPRCGAQELVMTTEMHFSMRALPEPEVGRLVQVRTLSDRHAHLHRGVWPIQGQAPALHWVEATVTEEGLCYESTLAPWVEAHQKQLLIEIDGVRKPWLRLDLAAMVKAFASNPQAGWMNFSLLAEPVAIKTDLDEAAQAIRISLACSPDQLEWYLEYLAECFEELAGEFWDGHAWTKACLARIGEAWVVSVGGQERDRINPSPPDPRPAPEPSGPPLGREETLARARELLAAGKPEEALELGRGMVRADFQELDRPDVLEVYLKATLALGALKDAELVLHRLIKACPERGEWHERLAEVRLRRGLPSDAKTSYQV